MAEGLGGEAAEVLFDLAIFYTRRGRSPEIRRLAENLLPILQTRDIRQGVAAALLYFRRLVETGQRHPGRALTSWPATWRACRGTGAPRFDRWRGSTLRLVNEPFFSASSILSQATAQALEFPSLLAVVSRFAASDLGRERVLGPPPFRGRRGAAPPAHPLRGGLAPAWAAAAWCRTSRSPWATCWSGSTTGRPPLEGIDLVRLADLGKATRAAAARIREAVPPCPTLEAMARGLPDLDPLLRRIERTLDRRGEVREDASPRLAALRQQIRSTRDQIYRDLGEFVSSHKDELSEETIPMRGGRLVVMLQSGAKGRTSGLVHGRSATGKSFYFEPLHVVETNNTLQQSVEDEEAERHRILVELIEAAREALPDLREHVALPERARPPAGRRALRRPLRRQPARDRRAARPAAPRRPATRSSIPAWPSSARRPWARPGTRATSCRSTSSSRPAAASWWSPAPTRAARPCRSRRPASSP